MTANIGAPAAQTPPWEPISRRNTERAIDRSRDLDRFLLADVPDPATTSRLIIVTDEIGGPTVAFSDGTDWRRLQDLAVIS